MQDLNHNGFAQGQETVDMLKAMQAGHITGRDTTNMSLTQEPLKVESLEKTLKLLEFRLKDIKLWNSIEKLPAYNTVEEFLQLESYGQNRGGFYNEGELSDVEDSIYKRRAEYVKYIQVTGEVTLQAQMVRSYVDAMQKEVQNKMMWILRRTNSALVSGDASIVPQEFNSIYKQHASIGNSADGYLYSSVDSYMGSGTVIDLRGKSLTQYHLEDAAIRIDDNYGDVDTIFGPPSVLSGLAQDFFDKQRVMLNGPAFAKTDVIPKVISTSIGDIALQGDKMMKTGSAKTLNDNAESDKAPSQVTPDATTPAAVVADANSKFSTAEGLGNVFYAVASINRYGRSALKLINAAAVTLADGSSVNLKFAPGASAVPATGFEVYRTKATASTAPAADGVKFYPIFKVSTADVTNGYDGGAAGLVRDRNRFLPDTEQAFIGTMSDEVMSFKQLAPLSKLDLAILALSNRFITFLFGTPQLYTPKKMVRLVNVGKFVQTA